MQIDGQADRIAISVLRVSVMMRDKTLKRGIGVLDRIAVAVLFTSWQ